MNDKWNSARFELVKQLISPSQGGHQELLEANLELVDSELEASCRFSGESRR